MRDQSISRSVTVTASRSVTVTGRRIVFKDSTLNNVSYISSGRQGSPSWIIRCIETGAIFKSQRAAALAMDISKSNISRQLNGLQESAQGYTFERICMAA